MCGTLCLFSRIPTIFAPFPLSALQCWTRCQLAFPFEQHCMGEEGKVEFGPLRTFVSMWKTIGGRGSAFCKSVPHNFGQDCRGGLTINELFWYSVCKTQPSLHSKCVTEGKSHTLGMSCGCHVQAFLIRNRVLNLLFWSEIGYIFCLFGFG